MATGFEVVRLEDGNRIVGDSLATSLNDWKGDKECFLFVTPHDDDAILGGGLVMQMAIKENVPVYIMAVTDGSMGYCTKEEKDSIAEIRKAETFDCYEALGIPKENIVWLGFPDCRLNEFIGRRKAGADEAAVVEGFTGLQNAFTHQLRKINPTRVFLPTNSDLHPDHRIVHSELLISLFHAAGGIWPELGDAIEAVPQVYELGVYCDFPDAPTVRITTPQEVLDGKVEGIRKFKSQTQIESLIQIVQNSGPQEYLRDIKFRLYNPTTYKSMFDA